MSASDTLNLCKASFYCGSFVKQDERIEKTLRAIEGVAGRRLSHYVRDVSAPKAIPRERVQWGYQRFAMGA